VALLAGVSSGAFHFTRLSCRKTIDGAVASAEAAPHTVSLFYNSNVKAFFCP